MKNNSKKLKTNYNIYYYYYSFYLQSDAVPLQIYADCAYYYKENPPVPIWRQKPREYIEKMLCPKVKENPYLVMFLLWVSIQGFTCLYFTNISIRCNIISISNIYFNIYPFFSSSSSFIYYCSQNILHCNSGHITRAAKPLVVSEPMAIFRAGHGKS